MKLIRTIWKQILACDKSTIMIMFCSKNALFSYICSFKVSNI